MANHIKPKTPKDGQESVWDYPRPPRIEKIDKRIQVIFNGITIADTTNAYRILETSHPPTYYIPEADIKMEYLEKTTRNTFCEFKGAASYYTIKIGNKQVENAAWTYEKPNNNYKNITNHICFYPSKMEACYVDNELAVAQEGDFYGGWITSDIIGPFKGGIGTRGW